MLGHDPGQGLVAGDQLGDDGVEGGGVEDRTRAGTRAVGSLAAPAHVSTTRPSATCRWRVPSVVTASRKRRSWVTSSSVPDHVARACSSCSMAGEVEVVGRLVEHQPVGADAMQQRQRGPGPLARRQRVGRPGHVVGAEPELGQQRPGLGQRQPGLGQEPRRAGSAEPCEAASGPGRARRPRHRGPSRRSPAVSGSRPSSASTSVDLPAPLGPTTPPGRPSRPPGRPGRAERAPLRRRRSARRADHRRRCARPSPAQPQLPALEGLVHHLQPLQRLVGPGRPCPPSSPRSGMLWWRMFLSGSLGPLGLGDALGRPLPVCWRWARASWSPGGGVAGVGLLGVAAGRGPLVEVGQPAAVEACGAVRVCSSSSTTPVTVRSRKARSWRPRPAAPA